MSIDLDYGKKYSGDPLVQQNMGIGILNVPSQEGKAEIAINSHVLGDHRDGTICNNSRYPRRLDIFPLNN